MKQTSLLAKLNARRTQKGVTLVETLIVIGILAIIILTALIIYPLVKASVLSNREASNMSTIAASLANVYAGSSSYAGLTTAIAIDEKVFPTSMLQGTPPTTATNSFGGTVVLAPATPPGGQANTGYTITSNNISDNACSKIVNTESGAFDAVSIDGTVVKANSSSTVSTAAVATACSATATTDAHVLVFTGR